MPFPLRDDLGLTNEWRVPGSPDTEVKGDKIYYTCTTPVWVPALAAAEGTGAVSAAPRGSSPACTNVLHPTRKGTMDFGEGWLEGGTWLQWHASIWWERASRKESERGWKGDWPEIKMLAHVSTEILKGRAHLLCTGCKGAVAPHFQARWCPGVLADCCFLCHWVWPQLGPAGMNCEGLWQPLSEKIKMPRKKVQLNYTVPWFSFQYHWSLAVLDWCIVVALEDLPFGKKKIIPPLQCLLYNNFFHAVLGHFQGKARPDCVAEFWILPSLGIRSVLRCCN